jgi:citrate lyase subunit beta-like protein
LQASSNIDTLVVPKVNSASDLHFITDILRHALPKRHPSTPPTPPHPASAPPIRILALIESALAITSLPDICTASPYLSGLIFAAEDFALDLSITRTPSLTEFLYARSAIVTHARAYALPSIIDLVCTSYSGPSGMETLERECANGAGMGFNGKQCIHPLQVAVAQRVFAASEEDVVWAVRIAAADEKAGSAGRGSWTLDGKMIDRPVVGKAKAIVERAKKEGVVDVEAIRERWKGQEPE